MKVSRYSCAILGMARGQHDQVHIMWRGQLHPGHFNTRCRVPSHCFFDNVARHVFNLLPCVNAFVVMVRSDFGFGISTGSISKCTRTPHRVSHAVRWLIAGCCSDAVGMVCNSGPSGMISLLCLSSSSLRICCFNSGFSDADVAVHSASSMRLSLHQRMRQLAGAISNCSLEGQHPCVAQLSQPVVFLNVDLHPQTARTQSR